MLAAAAALPLLPYLVHVVRAGVPRYAIKGDFAALELAIRYVPQGTTLLGPYSRFKFNHPGPFFFYLVAPFYRALGQTSAVLYAGACVVNTAAALAIVASLRIAGGRAAGVAGAVGVLGWLAAFGNVCVSPWNPLLIVLPLAAFLVLSALTCSGARWSAPAAALFGAFAAQTHVAAVPTVAVVGLVVAVSLLGAASRGGKGRPLAVLLVFVAVVVVTHLPPLLEQVGAGPHGNLQKLVRFFMNRPEPVKPLAHAIKNLFLATGWLPDRALEMTLRTEGEIPRVMGWDPVPPSIGWTAKVILVLHAALLVTGGIVAARRRDALGVALIAVGLLGELSALASLRSSVGPDYYYLLFWTTAASTVAWIGGLTAITRAAAPPARALAACAAVLLGAASFGVTLLQRGWIVRNHPAPVIQPTLRDVQRAVRDRLEREGAAAVVHVDGAWEYNVGLMLELLKDGVPVYVHDDDRWLLGRQPPSMPRSGRLLHLFAALPQERPYGAEELAVVAESGPLQILTPVEPGACSLDKSM